MKASGTNLWHLFSDKIHFVLISFIYAIHFPPRRLSCLVSFANTKLWTSVFDLETNKILYTFYFFVSVRQNVQVVCHCFKLHLKNNSCTKIKQIKASRHLRFSLIYLEADDVFVQLYQSGNCFIDVIHRTFAIVCVIKK